MKPAGKNISVLGSTGSIGVNTLNVIRSFPERFTAVGLAAGRNVRLLAEQAAEFRPRLVAVLTEPLARELKGLLDPAWGIEVVWGEEGFLKAASLDEAETLVSAMVGAAGLRPTWAAIQAGKRIALANKETLVTAGELIMSEAESKGTEILPVDSEHSAIFQVLNGQRREDLKRIILTASGGPFWDRSQEELATVTREDALAHPNWNMGAKISVDSATLMNKGLETIEAKWLFGLPWDKIAIHIHTQSIVHSLVEFVDGSVLAQLGLPDMRVPIAYALSYPKRLPLNLPGLDLPQTAALTFAEPDLQRFPCLALALEAGQRGGGAPAALNAANEVAVQSFLDGELAFRHIATVTARVMDKNRAEPLRDLEHVFIIDQTARAKAREVITDIKRDSR
ncbi:MAG: 1-deoxy-D-xylulose-5-phosphate reductoisomerase [Thermodesulfobacteriota bacterium]|nr:1-deoxy-D-xylulose-5-phosphate reductoisomerase [Thermodesulfobacteriota bacterium]